MAIEYNGKDIRVFAGMEGGEYSLYTVDQKTLLIREYYESWSNRTVKVSVADESYIPPHKSGGSSDGGGGDTNPYIPHIPERT